MAQEHHVAFFPCFILRAEAAPDCRRNSEEREKFLGNGRHPERLRDRCTFQGVDGLQKALSTRPELFVSTFTEKLLTYALGRGVEYYDAPAVRQIVSDAQAKDFRFSSVVLGIVNSTPFQMRRTL